MRVGILLFIIMISILGYFIYQDYKERQWLSDMTQRYIDITGRHPLVDYYKIKERE